MSCINILVFVGRECEGHLQRMYISDEKILYKTYKRGGAKRKLSKLYLEEILYGISCGGYVVGMNELLVILQLS